MTMSTLDPGQVIKSVYDSVSGGLQVNIVASSGMSSTIKDGTTATVATVKAASTAAIATDTALVVAISPNNPITTSNTANGPVSPGAAATNSTLIGAQYNTALPTLTNTQQAALQADASGRLLVSQPTASALNTTATQAGTWNINNISGTVSLPTNAAQETGGHLASVDTKLTTTVNGLKVDGSAVTQPVSGTVTANIGTTNGLALDATLSAASAKLPAVLGQSVMVNSLTVAIASDQSAVPASQSGTWNINNVSGTVSLPTGASTAAKQDTGNTSLASIDTKTPALGQAVMASSVPVAISSNQSAIPASQSGTWNINNVSGTVSLPTGASTDATLAKLTVAQGAALGANTQALIGGSVTTAAPTYTTGQISPLSLTTSGAIRTDASGSTQPVSGAVTVTQATGTNLHTVVDSGTVISNIGTTNGLALDATIANVQGTVAAGAAASKSSLIGGQFNTVLPTLINTQQAAVQLDSSGRVIIAQSSAAALNATVSGTVTSNQGTANSIGNAWTAKITDGTNTAAVTASSAVKVDGSAVTQPVSGTVTANAGTGTFTTSDLSDGSVSGGAAGSTSMLVGGQYNTAAPVLTNGQQAAIQLDTSARPVISPLTNSSIVKAQLQDNGGTAIVLGQAAMSASLPVVLASNQSVIPVSQSGTWSTRTQDGSGTAITSNTQGAKVGLNTSGIGYSAINHIRNDYSSTNVTTAAYTQVLASTSGDCQEIELFDSNGFTMLLATGSAGLEVDQVYITPGGNGRIKLRIASGTRIAIKAVVQTANSGEFTANLYG